MVFNTVLITCAHKVVEEVLKLETLKSQGPLYISTKRNKSMNALHRKRNNHNNKIIILGNNNKSGYEQ